MKDFNNVQLSGRLGADPEVRYGGANNSAVARFSIAQQKTFVKEGEKDVQWHNCVAFGSVAESIEKYVKKGMRIGIDGKIQYDNYTNKDGIKVDRTTIVIREYTFLDSKTSTSSEAQVNSSNENHSTNTSTEQPSGHTDFADVSAETDFGNLDFVMGELPFN